MLHMTIFGALGAAIGICFVLVRLLLTYLVQDRRIHSAILALVLVLDLALVLVVLVLLVVVFLVSLVSVFVVVVVVMVVFFVIVVLML